MKTRTIQAEEVIRAINPGEEVIDLRARVRGLERRLAEYKADTGSLLSFFRDLSEAIAALPSPPRAALYRRPAKKTAVTSPVSAVLHATDWHMGAVQQPDEIEGFAEFSPEVLEERIGKLAERFLRWVEALRSAYRVEELVILSTGDMISGDIHEELRVTNAFPAPVQVARAGELFAKMTAFLAPHFPRVRVEWVAEDNHARLTRKPQAAEAGMNSLNYLVGYIARERLRAIENVAFNIHAMYQVTIEVQHQRYLCTHGHMSGTWMGFPYYVAERKAGREAFKRMRADRAKFDKIVMGHWHSAMRHEAYWIGPSPQGTTAYDHRAGRYGMPAQAAWMVHPKYGEFNATDFRLDL